MTADELFFFEGKPEALGLYEALTEKLGALGLAYSIKAQKTQISFLNRYLFACVSFARVKKKAELPAHWLTVSFVLNYPKTSSRIAACSEVARNRFTHHVVVGTIAEIDDELLGWIQEAYDFSNSK